MPFDVAAGVDASDRPDLLANASICRQPQWFASLGGLPAGAQGRNARAAEFNPDDGVTVGYAATTDIGRPDGWLSPNSGVRSRVGHDSVLKVTQVTFGASVRRNTLAKMRVFTCEIDA